jgi:deoxyribonuclease IV
MKIGAHLSVNGGIDQAACKAAENKLNCLQIFTASPRDWKNGKISIQTIGRFKSITQKAKISSLFIHAKYLTNPGSDNQEIADKSIGSLIYEMNIAAKIKVHGVVFHPKLTHFEILIGNINKILAKTPKISTLILENSAQMSLKELGEVFKKIKSPRLKFCLDTAHIFENGMNLNRVNGLQIMLETIKNEIGMEKLTVIHLNNSKTKLGSLHDFHADIAKGKIKNRFFTDLVNNSEIKKIPLILETPSLKEKNWQKTQENIDFLRSLIIK